MIYVDESGFEIELPKATVALEEQFDRAADRNRPKRERVKDAYKLMRDCLGADYVAQACGGKTAETADVVALWGLFDSVRDAYFGGMDAAQVERIAAQLETLAPVLDKMAKVSALIDATASRQGFRSVR